MFKCKACEKLERENAYLRTLIDRLLVKNNVTPVLSGSEPVNEELTGTDKLIADGYEVFGGD